MLKMIKLAKQKLRAGVKYAGPRQNHKKKTTLQQNTSPPLSVLMWLKSQLLFSSHKLM